MQENTEDIDDEAVLALGLSADSDVWASAETSFVQTCENPSCTDKKRCEELNSCGGEEKSSAAKNPEINDPHAPNEENQFVLGTNSATDVPSASELLLLVLQSYNNALRDQRSVMANQTEAINRLAAAIEDQTKMISLLRDSNR